MARAPFQVLVIPWRPHGAAIEVAVFHRADYAVWQFVSGGGEDAETPLEAATRELREEIGLDGAKPTPLDSMAMLPACWFDAWPSWDPSIYVIPEHAFAVQTSEVTLCPEHDDMRWCSVREAMEILRFDSNRHALWELNERVAPGPRIKRTAYK